VSARGPILTGAGADLQAGKIVFDYTNSGDNPSSTIEGMLATAYGYGFLSGQIRDTTAGASGLALGWRDDDAANKVIVMATPSGDANLDGTVDSADYGIVINNYNHTGDWTHGDFNYNGAVNSSDLAAAQANFGRDVFLYLQDSDLAHLTRSLDADGSISRDDMMAILRRVETYGNLSATDFNDLKTIITDAAVLNMPNYVAVLAGDVVNGNTANAHYQDSTPGNLAIGSTPAHLETLVSKWFLGTDHPRANAPDPNVNYGYESVAGLPFGPDNNHVPSYNDVAQGRAATCYFDSTLAAIAVANPQVIQNMIQDNGCENGHHTWTVRFYADGVADYVTVDDQLPVDAQHQLVYDGYSWSAQDSSKFIWLPLLEKAYAQWTETGKVTFTSLVTTSTRSPTNSYSDYPTGIGGGYPVDVFAEVVNARATEIIGDAVQWSPTSSEAQVSKLNLALAQGEAVAVFFPPLRGSTQPPLGQDHVYALTDYDTQQGTYTLRNPYFSGGPNNLSPQPGAVTWSQIGAAGGLLYTADVSNSERFG